MAEVDNEVLRTLQERFGYCFYLFEGVFLAYLAWFATHIDEMIVRDDQLNFLIEIDHSKESVDLLDPARKNDLF